MAARHEVGVQGSYRVPAAIVSDAINDSKKHLLLAASGSVATIKLPLVISSFENHPNLSIRVIVTKAATHFLAGQSPEQPTIPSLALLPNVDAVHLDEDEWIDPWTRHSKILHIELRKWGKRHHCFRQLAFFDSHLLIEKLTSSQLFQCPRIFWQKLQGVSATTS